MAIDTKTENAGYGMLIDYKYCTGCHSCEVSCQERFGMAAGEYGIKLSSNGPWDHGNDNWEWNWVPIPTQKCDLCVDRRAAGKKALCETHCQALVITVGKLEDLVKKMDESREQVIFNRTNDVAPLKARY